MFSNGKYKIFRLACAARLLVGVPLLLALAAPALAQTFAPGDFCTYTQGGWGAVPQGNNPGTILHNDYNFSTVFGGAVVVGDSPYSMKFTTPDAITAYLPAGGKPKPLDGSYTDPTTTKSGVFGGQVLALQLNVLYDPTFGGLTIMNTGMTVAEVLIAANIALGGGALPSGYTLSNLNDLVSLLNQGFDNCLPSGWVQQFLVPASGGGSLPGPS